MAPPGLASYSDCISARVGTYPAPQASFAISKSTIPHASLFSVLSPWVTPLAISADNSGRLNTSPLAAVVVSGIWPHILALSLSGLVTTVKIVSMLAVALALSYSAAVIATFVPWVSGRVTLMILLPFSPVMPPILVAVSLSESPSITTAETMPSPLPAICFSPWRV
ncbi:Uncharacterised protein [Salmonella enterica subsp. enterica serovar Typhimurium str. DT104]|nr:Uncharacterised protein [Salmonella enterica subsp. enterica serovar Typhimurium str. DT104]CQM04691.1 Uncharacterised protein [Salmonella enterica subsp. enterica serovar Typhimurium str. DT104]CQN08838.1 Uncharacterised protein [Salmonella enterica subsp. enterica serovar Typhimurium str. DT104]